MKPETKQKIKTTAKIVGGTIVTVGVGYLVYDNITTKSTNRILVAEIDEHKEMINTLCEAASEGLYEEAIATVTRKANTCFDRINVIKERLKIEPDDKQSLESLTKYTTKFNVLLTRKDKFIKAQKVYEVIVDEE